MFLTSKYDTVPASTVVGAKYLLLLLLWFGHGQFEGLRLEVFALANLLPSAGSAFEVSECLCKLQWLGDNSLLFLIIANFRISREREVFP